MGAEDADRFAALDEQRFIVLQVAQLADDRIEGVPRTRGFAGAAVHDEVVRPLRDVGVEVVHEHAQCRFLDPAVGAQLAASRRPDHAAPIRNCHVRSIVPAATVRARGA
jgi:hypothetical protein